MPSSFSAELVIISDLASEARDLRSVVKGAPGYWRATVVGTDPESGSQITVASYDFDYVQKKDATSRAAELIRHVRQKLGAPKSGRPAKSLADKALATARLYLGSVDYASVRDQQRLYDRLKRDIEKAAKAFAATYDTAFEQVMREAQKLGKIRPTPGKDI